MSSSATAPKQDDHIGSWRPDMFNSMQEFEVQDECGNQAQNAPADPLDPAMERLFGALATDADQAAQHVDALAAAHDHAGDERRDRNADETGCPGEYLQRN